MCKQEAEGERYIDLPSEELCRASTSVTTGVQAGCALKYNANKKTDLAGMDVLPWPGMVSL